MKVDIKDFFIKDSIALNSKETEKTSLLIGNFIIKSDMFINIPYHFTKIFIHANKNYKTNY